MAYSRQSRSQRKQILGHHWGQVLQSSKCIIGRPDPIDRENKCRLRVQGSSVDSMLIVAQRRSHRCCAALSRSVRMNCRLGVIVGERTFREVFRHFNLVRRQFSGKSWPVCSRYFALQSSSAKYPLCRLHLVLRRSGADVISDA